MEYTIIPLGINCTTAISLNAINARKLAFPFDYITTSSYAYIRKILVLQKNNVKQFVDEYFSEKNFNKNLCKHVDGTEFPHMNPDKNWIWGGNDIIEKYIRRIERLLDMINNEQNIIFIIGSFNHNNDNDKIIFNEAHCTDIINYIKCVRNDKKSYFITYNLCDKNFKTGNNHINFNMNIIKNDEINYKLMGETLKTCIEYLSNGNICH